MKRLLLTLGLFAALAGALVAQDGPSPADQMIQTFEDAGQEIKLRVLRSAREQGGEEMGPLYRTALQYVNANSDTIDSDQELQEIARISVEGLVETGQSAAARDIWQLFLNYRDTQAREQLLAALAAVDAEDQRLLPSLNEWMATRHNLKRSGETIDERVMIAALEALQSYGSAASFNVVLNAVLLQYSARVGETAESFLFDLSDDPVAIASRSIRNRDAGNKLAALDYFLTANALSDDQRSAIASAALQDALNTDPSNAAAREALRRVRYTSAEELRRTSYSQATEAMIRHFNRTFLDYDRGNIRKTWVLEAIAGLGAMGTEEAAERLAQFLDLLNTYTENDRAYDTQITLAVIRNLQELGFPTAYNALFYASLLDYPDRITEAAQEAMASLAR